MSPQPEEIESLNKEFKHYLNYAKPLILKLKTVGDRKLASTWLLKLQTIEDADSLALRNDYIRVLYYCLSRRKLLEPFNRAPVMQMPLEELTLGTNIDEIMQKLVEIDKATHKCDKEDQEKLPYTVELSSNKKQYVALQEIPHFGVHCYFAVSADPIYHWENITDTVYDTSHKDIDTSVSFIGPPLGKRDSIDYSEPKEKDSHGLEGVEVHRVLVDILEKQPQAQSSQYALRMVNQPPTVTTKIPMTRNFHATWQQMNLR